MEIIKYKIKSSLGESLTAWDTFEEAQKALDYRKSLGGKGKIIEIKTVLEKRKL